VKLTPQRLGNTAPQRPEVRLEPSFRRRLRYREESQSDRGKVLQPLAHRADFSGWCLTPRVGSDYPTAVRMIAQQPF
jgi:hypothetical protein